MAIEFETERWSALKAFLRKMLLQAQLQDYRPGSFGRAGFAVAPRNKGTEAGIYYLHNGAGSYDLYLQRANEALKRYQQVVSSCADIEAVLQKPICNDGWPYLEVTFH